LNPGTRHGIILPMKERRLSAPVHDIVSAEDITSELVLQFHQRWQDAGNHGGIPSRRAFPTENLKQWLGSIQIVDVVGDGEDFRHRLIGTKIVEAVGRDLTGKKVSECTYEIGTEQMLARYRYTLAQRGCVFRRGRAVWAPDKSWRQFEMITAPLSDDGARIDQLISVMDYPTPQ
jgi:hypothetical protein